EAELEHLDAGAALEEEAEVGVDVEEGPRRVGADLVGPGGGSIAPERGVQTEVVAGTERPDGLGEATEALEPQVDGGNFAGAGGGEAVCEPVAFPIGAGTEGQIVERSRPDLEPEAGEIAGKEGALRPGGAQAEGGAELGGRSLEIQGEVEVGGVGAIGESAGDRGGLAMAPIAAHDPEGERPPRGPSTFEVPAIDARRAGGEAQAEGEAGGQADQGRGAILLEIEDAGAAAAQHGVRVLPLEGEEGAQPHAGKRFGQRDVGADRDEAIVCAGPRPDAGA